MSVIVHNRKNRQQHDDITSLGIGHIRQDLVLVASESAIIEIGP